MLEDAMVLEVKSIGFKLRFIPRTNKTSVFFLLFKHFVLFSLALEGVDNDTIDNIDHYQHDSEVENPIENKLRPIMGV